MTIKIHKNALQYLTENELKLLLLLEFHEGFEIKIKDIRDELQISDRNKTPDPIKLQKEAYNLTRKLKYPISLAGSISDVIAYGKIYKAVVPIQVFDVDHQANRKILYSNELRPAPPKFWIKKYGDGLEKNWYKHNKNTFSNNSISAALPILQINKPLSETEFIYFAKKQFKEIKQATRQFEKSVPYYIKIKKITLKELKINSVIYRLRKRKKPMPHLKIYSLLKKEYGVDYDDADKTVMQKYSDMKKILKDMGFLKSKI